MRTFILAILLSAGFAAQAQKVQVLYEGEWSLNDFERAMLAYNDMVYMKVTVDTGSADNYLMELTLVTCTDGTFEQKTLLRYPVPGKETLPFLAGRKEYGTVRLGAVTGTPGNFTFHEIPCGGDKPYIFMETYPEGFTAEPDPEAGKIFHTDADEIPIVAYTTGVRTEFDYMGQTALSYDYCALRDKHMHPEKWYSEAGIEDYIYYTVKLIPLDE